MLGLHVNTQQLLQKQGTVKTEMDVGCHSVLTSFWQRQQRSDTPQRAQTPGSTKLKRADWNLFLRKNTDLSKLELLSWLLDEHFNKSQNDGQISIQSVLVVHGPQRLNLRVLLTSWLLSQGQNIHFWRRSTLKWDNHSLLLVTYSEFTSYFVLFINKVCLW